MAWPRVLPPTSALLGSLLFFACTTTACSGGEVPTSGHPQGSEQDTTGGHGNSNGNGNGNGSGNGNGAGNSGDPRGTDGGSTGASDAGSSGPFTYKEIFDAVDATKLQGLLKDMCGVNPVTANGSTFTIKDRYLPASKANYRSYWSSYFTSLGLSPQTLTYTTQSGAETSGHNVEAVLPGKVKDSVVILVHYDSIGPHGADNPGADDDMTGMATLMETARILSQYKGRLQHTVRFVATDYEEWSTLNLEGARMYAQYIKKLASDQGFQIVAAIDNEQAGWKQGANTIDIVDHVCGKAALPAVAALGKLMTDTASAYSGLTTTNLCNDGSLSSDYEAMANIGVPAFVFSEHDPSANNHFDKNGNDTYAAIDQAYFVDIARVGVTFAARVVGIDP